MASYRKAIRYLAGNDEPHEYDPAAMAGYASVHVLAEAFGKTEDEVAEDVIRQRYKDLETTVRDRRRIGERG